MVDELLTLSEAAARLSGPRFVVLLGELARRDGWGDSSSRAGATGG